MPKILTGHVVSVKTQKSLTVEVESRRHHPLYKKLVKKTKKYKVHNDNLKVETGDLVKIIETKPISREKHFKLIEVVKKP
ncbi:MAG: 30S ribosomal protein S17 [bacterium]|nr:30S ribosomal protein S17 [bacterium]